MTQFSRPLWLSTCGMTQFSRPLRLTVPRHNLERFGRRGFSVNAPHLWNDLTDNLRLIDSVVLFKRHIKTHLFRAAFSVYL